MSIVNKKEANNNDYDPMATPKQSESPKKETKKIQENKDYNPMDHIFNVFIKREIKTSLKKYLIQCNLKEKKTKFFQELFLSQD